MWIVGVVIIVVIAACVLAIFLGGGQGPFVAISKLGSSGKITTTRGRADFQGDLKKPRNESELL